MLSGNRNFEGRVHPNVRANYLASPPLVVAYALLGKMTEDITTAPLGTGKDGKPVYLRDVWPTNKEIADIVAACLSREQFLKRYGEVFKGPKQWQAIQVDTGSETYRWSDGSTYVKNPPYFEGITMDPPPVGDIKGARILAELGDSITTDHISPAGSIRRPRRPATTCWNARCCSSDFNSYGARRGNHEVMMRGTFANIRIRNEMLTSVEGGMTKHLPSGEQMPIYDAAMRYKAEGVPLVDLRRQGIRHRLVARLGGEGHAAARHQGGDRRELRAHPPLQPGRHGRAAADLQGRHGPQVARHHRRGDDRHRSAWSRTSRRAWTCRW